MAFKKIPAKNKQGYKWECVKDGPINPVTNKRNQIRRRADTKRDAEAKVDAAIELLEQGINPKKAKSTGFEFVAEEWLHTYSKTGVKPGTIRIRKKEIKILLRYYMHTAIASITHGAHQKLLNDLDDQGYARTTIEGVHVTAGMIFKYSIKHKYRLDNPAAGCFVPKKVKTVEEIENATIEDKYLKREEIKEVLDAAEHHGLEGDFVRFYLLVFSGMRPGELCALKWTDIDFEARTVRISKTIQNEDLNMRKYSLGTPKTEAGIRTFTIDAFVIELLKDHKEKWDRLDAKNPPEHNANFIFRHTNGYPLVQKNVQQRLERLSRFTTIERSFTPYIFRHTYVSMLAEAGVPLKTIMQRVGHEDEATTLNVYMHVTQRMQEDADKQIRIAFSDLLDRPVLRVS